MTAKSLPFANVAKQSLSDLIDGLDPVVEAILSLWCRRKWRKIGPKEIVLSFLAVMLVSGGSYSRIARAIGIPQLKTVSRQAVQKRMNKYFVNYLNRLVARALLIGMNRLAEQGCLDGGIFNSFTSVVLHDSTCIALPDALEGHFPGAWNGRGDRKAMLKVDTMLDLKHWCIRRLVVNPYTTNDQSQALVALDGVVPGGLVIRDLGYFKGDALKAITDKGAFFVSRLQYGVGLHASLQSGPLDLDKLLIEGQDLDCRVLMGALRLPVRLVAIALPQSVAEERRRKASKEAAKGGRARHSDEYMRRLGWTILVTNVEEGTWTASQVDEAYRYRWFVETLFKSWKSHWNLAGQPCPKKPKNPYKREPKHPYKAESVVLALLLLAVLVQIPLIAQLKVANPKAQISMLQVARLVADHCIHATAEEMEFIITSLSYLCKYDKRKRGNAASRLAGQSA